MNGKMVKQLDENNDAAFLIVDFGSQVTQLIARRVREERRLFRDRAVPVGRRSLRA
jgi:hypothetical protein